MVGEGVPNRENYGSYLNGVINDITKPELPLMGDFPELPEDLG